MKAGRGEGKNDDERAGIVSPPAPQASDVIAGSSWPTPLR
jgi:hypothetical protein